MLNRAYSLLQVKGVDEDARILTGMATTPTPDRLGDVVEPDGAQFKLPIALLWQHDSHQPIGHVTKAKVTPAGIEIVAKMARIAEPGQLKDRLDEAWQSIKAGLVQGLSIGFKSLEHSHIKDGNGVRFLKWLWLELSAVTIPANAEATIATVKSLDTAQRAASGQTLHRVVHLTPPGASGRHQTSAQEGATMKTVSEQITALEAKRAASTARMNAVMQQSLDEDRTSTAEEQEDFDARAAEVEAIDNDLVRLRKLENTKASTARPLAKIETTHDLAATRSSIIVKAPPKLPPGTAFARYVIAMARSDGNLMQAMEISKQWDESTPEVGLVFKAAVAAGTTTDPAWAAPLVPYQVMASEFINILRPMTIIGRIPGLRRVPFNIQMPAQTTPSTVGWVGEGKPKPVSALAFTTVTFRWAKVAGIVVLTDELVRFSNPSAEALVTQDLADTITQFLDRQFVDPAVAAVANVSPASITNGVTPVPASGTDFTALKHDIATLFSTFTAANMSVAGAVWIMTETMAMTISQMITPLGTPEFPGVTPTGGTLYGLPVIASENIPATGGVPANGQLIILAKAPEIFLADDGGVTIDVSREASLQMDSAPDAPPAATTVFGSLWQMNMVGIRAERIINWQKRRTGAVQFISGAKYTA